MEAPGKTAPAGLVCARSENCMNFMTGAANMWRWGGGRQAVEEGCR